MKNWVLHPILFAVTPFLSLYVTNIEKAHSREFFISSLQVIVIVSIILLITNLLFKNYKKTGLFISIVVILFFLYGTTYDYLRDFFVWIFHSDAQAKSIVRHRHLIPIFLLLFAAIGCYVFKSKRKLTRATSILNLAAFVIIALNVVSCTMFLIKKTNVKNIIPIYSGELISPLKATTNQPDIYYITVDEYVGFNTVRNYFGYNPDAFIGYLQQKGFFITSRSKSNYRATEFSLSASLNMEYIHLNKALLDSQKVTKLLKSIGYRFVSDVPLENISDFFLLSVMKNELMLKVISNSMLRMFIFDFYRNYDVNIFNHFNRIVKLRGPKFVHIHIPCPHPPYVWGANGEKIDTIGWRWDDDGYLNQWKFVTKKLPSIIDTILIHSPPFPIIILQADHGAREMKILPGKYFPLVRGKPVRNGDQTIENYMNYNDVSSGILNAYFFPDKNYSGLYDSISPVNSFRVVFNKYFNAHYPLLKDESF
jgi:FtsH-binding integral membrane protein